MIKFILNNRLLFLGIHIIIGYLSTFSFFPKVFTGIIFLIAIPLIFINNNKNEEAFLFSAYLVSAEVFLRMTNGLI